VVILFISVLAISIVSAAEKSKPDISMTYFAQTRFDATIDDDGLKNDQFRVSRVRIRATGKMLDKLGFFVQLDPGSSPALKDARLRVNIHKYLTLQAGRFLLPFGIQTPVNPYSLTTVDYCQVISTLNKGLWDIGASVYGKYPLNDKIALSYVGAAVNGNTGGFADNNKSKDYLGRVGLSLPEGISLGGSVYIGKKPKSDEKPDDDVTKNRFGGDLKIDYAPFLLKSEFLIGKDDETDSMGFYAIAAYKVLPNVQLAGKFDFLDVNTDKDDDESTIISGGVNYYFAGQNILQLFYKLMDKPGDTTEHGIIGQLAMTFDL
jgi:hypothetical protein